ncbi:follistatin-related protein 4-like [Pimephales promelas]|uniref:follistatin-related protein 4-like n=1 Tax=Pimephales promelas TaxID=90988 RepID=UPI0019555EB1|nr:follistatin-related protein 4-like [Pimephales promelas]
MVDFALLTTNPSCCGIPRTFLSIQRLALMGWLWVWVWSVLLGSSLRLAHGVRAGAGTGHTVKRLQEDNYGGVEHKVKPNEGPCRRTYCGRGRECVVRNVTGRVECVCQERCHTSFVPVCGSDGRFYENHCELYRTACLQRRRIYVVHSKDCFFRGDTCTMAEYNKLKNMLLDMQPRTAPSGEPDAMDQRRALVDTMFKYIDRDQDGRLSSEELAERNNLKNTNDLLVLLKGKMIGELTQHTFDPLRIDIQTSTVRIILNHDNHAHLPHNTCSIPPD